MESRACTITPVMWFRRWASWEARWGGRQGRWLWAPAEPGHFWDSSVSLPSPGLHQPQQLAWHDGACLVGNWESSKLCVKMKFLPLEIACLGYSLYQCGHYFRSFSCPLKSVPLYPSLIKLESETQTYTNSSIPFRETVWSGLWFSVYLIFYHETILQAS